jgi:hypothetical protein
MAKLRSETRIYGTGTVDTQLFINGSTTSTNSTTGALIVNGGVGIGNKLFVGGDINCYSEVTAYYGSTSDIKLKTNIVKIDNGLAKLLTLDGITYNWNQLSNKDTSLREAGVIAQQVEQVLPEAVIKKENGYLTVKYEKIVPLLIEAIKELHVEIEQLKKKIQ